MMKAGCVAPRRWRTCPDTCRHYRQSAGRWRHPVAWRTAECTIARIGGPARRGADGRPAQSRHRRATSPYPPSPGRDTIGATRARGRMRRRREFILGLAMPLAACRASAGRARRVGALVVEQTQEPTFSKRFSKERGGNPVRTSGSTIGSQPVAAIPVVTDRSRRDTGPLQPDVLFAVSNTSMAAAACRRFRHCDRFRPGQRSGRNALLVERSRDPAAT